MTFGELHIGEKFVVVGDTHKVKEHVKVAYATAYRERDKTYVGLPQDKEVTLCQKQNHN